MGPLRGVVVSALISLAKVGGSSPPRSKNGNPTLPGPREDKSARLDYDTTSPSSAPSGQRKYGP